MYDKCNWRLICCLMVLCSLSTVEGLSADSPDDILQSAGVKGGLVVHLGCGDGALTTALRANDSYLVHGLDADAGNVRRARDFICSKGLYGCVSADTWNGKSLPYADNLVNLIVVSDAKVQVSDTELMRVLAPLGVAWVNGQKTVKPWPSAIDEWTHFMHGPDNNAVSADTAVGPPRRLQWTADPSWARNHEIRKMFRAMVSSKGRVFYCVDEGQTGLIGKFFPDRWTIVARDAFNGVLLWKLPVDGMVDNSQMIASGDRLYVNYGPKNAPASIVILDAATAQTVKTIGQEGSSPSILLSGRNLITHTRMGKITATDVDSGKVLWNTGSRFQAAYAVAANKHHVAFSTGEDIVCLNLADGELLWRGPRPQNEQIPDRTKGKRTAELVLHDNLVILHDNHSVFVIEAETGKLVWAATLGSGGALGKKEFYVARNCVWTSSGKVIVGYDLITGKQTRAIDPAGVHSRGHHFRCYHGRATERYLITQARGAEFISMIDDQHSQNDWVRGACHYGVMPANGILYTPANECFCYPGAKLVGFNALVSAEQGALDTVGSSPLSGRLEKGPSYAKVQASTAAPKASVGNWPIYRQNSRRAGAAKCEVPSEVEQKWKIKLDGEVTPPVVVDGCVFLAVKDRHSVHAIDANSTVIAN